jgi:hypothetical protein
MVGDGVCRGDSVGVAVAETGILVDEGEVVGVEGGGRNGRVHAVAASESATIGSKDWGDNFTKSD